MEIAWQSDGVELPKAIEQALETDSLVLFCGAGISAAPPSSLPGFRGLVEEIASELGRSDLLPDDPLEPVQFDVVMGELDELQHDVRARVTSRLLGTIKPNLYHRDLLRITRASACSPRIVTTNFDLLFEAAADELGLSLPTHLAPALPLGNDFTGLVHLHGPVNAGRTQRMVVTDTDFGRAYITEGWATQFLTRMFERYVTLFIGYSADDTVMRYLARALPADGQTRFAFMEAEQENPMAARWQRLGVTPIPYPSPDDARHVSLGKFIGNWRKRLLATPSERFDRVQSVVSAGPDHPALVDRELLWLINDPEHARHFRGAANPTSWIPRLDTLGALDSIFDPSAVSPAESVDWAKWAAGALSTNHGAVLLTAITRGGGHLSQALWFHVWLHLHQDYEPVEQHRRWLLLLAADQGSRDNTRLSSLLRPITDKDPAAAEILLHLLLIPKLTIKAGRDWFSASESLEPDLVLPWSERSVREAWPTLLPSLSDPAHLLSDILSLIHQVEAAEALFSGKANRRKLSLRRNRVDGVDPYRRDDPYVLVVDLGRDLLREFVRGEGSNRAVNYLDSSSEMVQRMALDALSEARSGEADVLLKVLIERGLVYELSARPEVFRLMKTMYRHASADIKEELLEHILRSDGPDHEIEVRPYERYNALVWLSTEQDSGDPVQEALGAMQKKYPNFAPREHPDVNFWVTVGGQPEPEEEAAGRFRELTPEDLVAALAVEPTIDAGYDGRAVLLELQDYLDHISGQELDLMDSLLIQSVWSPAVWSTVLRSAVRLGQAWAAAPLLERLDRIPQDLDDIARAVDFFIAYPTLESGQTLENAEERCRLLLGLWRRVTPEPSEEPPTSPSDAHSTVRGSLAYFYVETVLRTSQQRGATEIDSTDLVGFSELMASQDANASDPSPMMLARYAGNILAWAPEWFNANLQTAMLSIDATPQSRSLWAGILTSNLFSRPLMLHAREALRVGWPQVSKWLPGSVEAFIDIHAAQFAYYTDDDDYTWADPFIASAPMKTRVRWIRTVARHLDREAESSEHLLFAHWRHRINGQPPIQDPEQMAFIEWVTIPGIDISRAAELFCMGPVASSEDEDIGFDYYDLDRFPPDHNAAFLRVALHLLRGRSTLPPFLSQIDKNASDASAEDHMLAQQVWSELLRLGYSPARDHLDS